MSVDSKSIVYLQASSLKSSPRWWFDLGSASASSKVPNASARHGSIKHQTAGSRLRPPHSAATGYAHTTKSETLC